MQAVSAVNTFNGTDLAGRKIMVREDREDRDVKQYNRENGIETPPVPRCVGQLLEAGSCPPARLEGAVHVMQLQAVGGGCCVVWATAAELESV